MKNEPELKFITGVNSFINQDKPFDEYEIPADFHSWSKQDQDEFLEFRNEYYYQSAKNTAGISGPKTMLVPAPISKEQAEEDFYALREMTEAPKRELMELSSGFKFDSKKGWIVDKNNDAQIIARDKKIAFEKSLPPMPTDNEGKISKSNEGNIFVEDVFSDMG